MLNPLEQFEIHNILPLSIRGIDLSVTNAALMMLINLIVALTFMHIVSSKTAMVPNRKQMLGEILYNMISDMVITSSGQEAKKYMPFMFSLFLFIIVSNSMGMLPYTFTVTSHIIVTFIMAIAVFICVTTVGFLKHGTKYLRIFLPEGTPVFLAPMMICIEFFSYIIRPITLSVRLAANITAGHIVMKVIASFVIMAGIAGFAPFVFIVLLTGFEIFVAILQAYIFTILSCIYLSNAVKLH